LHRTKDPEDDPRGSFSKVEVGLVYLRDKEKIWPGKEEKIQDVE
jgi:hypothetical protein